MTHKPPGKLLTSTPLALGLLSALGLVLGVNQETVVENGIVPESFSGWPVILASGLGTIGSYVVGFWNQVSAHNALPAPEGGDPVRYLVSVAAGAATAGGRYDLSKALNDALKNEQQPPKVNP